MPLSSPARKAFSPTSLRFKLDENLPTELCNDFTAYGHQADTVHDEGLTGAADSIILERVRLEERILLTMDKGITDIRQYPPDQYAGIVLVRSTTEGRGAIASLVRRHLPELLQRELKGRLLILTDRSIRGR
jgi:predicted nuclease of predicted toxin-antitoxin system